MPLLRAKEAWMGVPQKIGPLRQEFLHGSYSYRIAYIEIVRVMGFKCLSSMHAHGMWYIILYNMCDFTCQSYKVKFSYALSSQDHHRTSPFKDSHACFHLQGKCFRLYFWIVIYNEAQRRLCCDLWGVWQDLWKSCVGLSPGCGRRACSLTPPCWTIGHSKTLTEEPFSS